ncbi:GGDEF domain-containing protein [Aquabacterium sp.]|uniref:GGDEF domain-containing protein n=1 Tax=Aquabacterium sp. TaxID=1872578 RepID=UPI0035AEDCF1
MPDAVTPSRTLFANEHHIRQHVLRDMGERVHAAVLLYPLLWLLIAQIDHFFWREPLVTAIFLIPLTLIAGWRRWLGMRLERTAFHPLDQTFLQFRLLACAHILVWSIATSVSLAWPPMAPLSLLLIVVGVALLIGATVSLSLDEVLSIAFTASGILPFVATALFVRGQGHIVLAILCVAFGAYVIGAGRVVRNDYISGLHARYLAEERARQLESLSLTDALTQIPNRLCFDQRYAMAWADARRQNAPLTLALIDLDHFKRINDSHGHLVGDRCLQDAAHIFQREVMRPTDLVARYGGEEFIVLMPGTDLEGGLQVAHRMNARLSSTELVQGGSDLHLRCSIGVATLVPGQDDRPSDLVRMADEALYLAKANGRNRVEAARTAANDSKIA